MKKYWLGFMFLLQVAQAAFAQNQPGDEPLLDSVEVYRSKKKYQQAFNFAQKLAEKSKNQSGDQSLLYAKALGLMGEIQLRLKKPDEAQLLFTQSLSIFDKVLPDGNLDAAFVNHHMGSMVFNTQNNLEKAEEYLLKAEEIKTRMLPEMHPDNIATWQKLGALYINTAQYAKSEAYYKKCLKANQKHYPNDPKKVPETYTDLSILYSISGDFPKAESAGLTAIQLYEKHLKEDEIPSGPLNALGHTYDGLGNYPKAEQCYFRAFRIIQKTLPPNHPIQFKILTSLGGHFVLSGQYQQAVFWLQQAIQLRDKLQNDKVERNAFEEGNLMIAYQGLGLYSKAEKMGKIVVEVREELYGPHHYNTANAYSSMADLYMKTNRLAEAKVYINKMGNAYEKSYGIRFPDFETQFFTGSFDWFSGDYGKAKVSLGKSMETMKLDVARYFPALSDHEKAQFYTNQIIPKVNFYTSFCMQQANRFPDLVGEEYNLTLATKALLLGTSARWKQRIKTSGDKKLFALYTQWEVLQNRLANWHRSDESGSKKQFDSTLSVSEKLEKELSVRSESFGKMPDKLPVTWKQIQARLKPGEAAIEIIRFQKLGIEKTVIDTSASQKPRYAIKGLSDTIYYAALLLKWGQAPPEMVLLKNGDELEGKYLNFYQNAISKQLLDTVSYQQFWSKIGKKLSNFSRVYFSPDGVFHQINLNTLYNPKTKKFLLEEKDVRTVTVTKDIVNTSLAEEENRLVQLVGFPSYYLSAPTASIATSERKSPEMSYKLRLESVGTLAELPGTKTEVDKIQSIFEEKGWDAKQYTEQNALEANIKESYKPRVLHIATHGFFQPDTTKGSNPLLRSGLMLTGAGSTLKGEKNESGEDGILTAYEAMNLNLDNTDLVVLSACETGLGEIKNGEGVYGLQRAFKVAGARSLIMSLWKVDDDATQELMVGFYKNWLVGTSKRAAFLKAQKELKAKYPNPYYWGAFVMVGE